MKRSGDRVLAAALASAFLLCLHGITATTTHPDQMAFRPLFLPDKWPFNPGWFHKPPLYTYLNYVLSVWPTTAFAGALHLAPASIDFAALVWSRILAATFLLGSVVATFVIARGAFGLLAARIIAALLATSAGLIAYVHQLTADVPVMWWMVVALHFSLDILRNARTSSYVCAGLCTGLATATKYNGLGVGVAIVVAHGLRVLMGERASRRHVGPRLHGGLALGLAMVPVGFVLGNPFAVLDFPTFWADFRYNALVTPVYEGQSGTSFAAFFARLVELIGLPAFAVAILAAAASLVLVSRRGRPELPEATFWSVAAVALVYYLTFGRFPRLETRFVLPIVPFFLLLTGPCWARVRARTAALALVAVVVAYNLLCGAYVGRRFLDDPRLAVAAWMRGHVPPGGTVESDIYSPDADLSPESDVRMTTMPFVTGQERLFRQLFPGNVFVNGSEADQRAKEELVGWYAVAALVRRDPDYVVVNSLYYDRFMQPGIRRDLYPSMREFFTALLEERSPYRIVFDRRSPVVSSLLYPRAIDFLENRATVLARRAGDGG